MKFDPAERHAHYVRPNESVRIPRRHIFAHIESRTRATQGGKVNSWDVAVATFREGRKDRPTKESTHRFTTKAELWAAVAGHCAKGSRTVLWAHNLGLFVRLGDALHHLPHSGWDLVAHNLSPHGTWLQWSDGVRTLIMVDVAAVFPKTLGQIGKLFGLAEPNTPYDKESREYRLARVTTAEHIVRTAVTKYLAWIEQAEFGNWQYTGAGQSYAAFRHLHMKHKLLVHDDQEALIAERRAMWTGRCEAFWHGTMLRQYVDEWDFTSSYASICAERSLPTKLIGPMPPRYAWRRVLDDPNVALLAHVHVKTLTPAAPTNHNGRIIWPIGEYDSVLWDVEIKALIDAGAEVTVTRGWLYRKTPALAEWARWILASLNASDDKVPAWKKTVLKHHSTALIGRFSMAYKSWDKFCRDPHSGVRLTKCTDIDTGEQFELMQVGHQVYKQEASQEWQHSMPAITGYVMACARVKLWELIQQIPAEALLYVDTDSLLVTDRWRTHMQGLCNTSAGHGLRLKSTSFGFSIYGPRQIIVGPRVRVAGVPTGARRVARHTFEGEVWQSLAVSLGTGDAHQVIRRNRQWQAKCVDNRRIGPPIGYTRPIRIGASE